MKFTAIILLAACLQVSAESTAQEKITLSVKNASLAEVFKSIEKESGYVVWYEKKLLRESNPVTLQITNVSLDQALGEILRGQPLKFVISGKAIVISRREEAFQGEIMQNTIDITGKVLNEYGDPVPGATIAIKGGKSVTSTNDDGEFELKGINADAVIQISSVGYELSEMNLRGRTELFIKLKSKITSLDETHVIAYGTTTKRFSVGSVSKLNSSEISSQPVTNPLQALEGRIPGLVVSQTSGVPGATINIQIRGQNSLNSNPTNRINPIDNPFFIIDGVPFAPQNTNINQYPSLAAPASGTSSLYNNPYGGLSPFNSLDPSEIESIEVLRDADATAIYGSRAANGVILITTKKGKIGKPKFNISVNSGENRLSRTVPMMNTQQFLQMRSEAFRNDGDSATDPNVYAPDIVSFDTSKYTNWMKSFYGKVAHNTNLNASVSGGNANTQFLIGASYHHETYMFTGGYSDNRISVNSNIHHSSTNQRFLLDFSTSYSYDVNNSSGAPDLLKSYTLAPNYPDLLDKQNNLNWTYDGIDLYDNPLQYIKRVYRAQNYYLGSHLQIGYEVVPGLTLKSNFGYGMFNAHEYSAFPADALDPNVYGLNRTSRATANFATNDFQTWIVEPQVEFKKTIGFGKLNVLIGGTFQKNINSLTSVTGTNYNNDALLGAISAAGTITSASDGYNLYKYSAVFGRIGYIYNNKFILSITGRRDGSSRFGPGKQFGNFGSVAGGYIFSEENFVKRVLSVMSFGKLRMSYGTTGNDGIGNYQYFANWKPTTRSYQGTNGYTPQNLFNPDFSWSINKKFEAGIETGFFNNRLLAEVSWYHNRSSDQLISYILPTQTGFGSVIRNFQAVVQNTGWEFEITSTNIKSDHFNWSTTLNFTIPKNKLVAFPGLQSSSYAQVYQIGQSLNIIRGFKYVGVNDTTGLFQFETAKGDHVYYPTPFTDYVTMGNTDKIYGGLKNSIFFYGFQFDVFFQIVKQKGINYLQQVYQMPPGTQGYNLPTTFLSRWQKPGDHNSLQRLTQNYGSDAAGVGQFAFVSSSGVFSDASFVRLKTLALSYSINKSLLKRYKVQGMSIYTNIQNLFTITSYKVGDPETQSMFTIPPLKTVVIGLQLTF